MSKHVTSEGTKPHRPRSNLYFQEVGLRKKIQYAISLSNPANPNIDCKNKHPNECSPTNQHRIEDITKRITDEHVTRLKLLAVRLQKRTGNRRIAA